MKKGTTPLFVAVLAASAMLAGVQAAQAETLQEVIGDLLITHDRIRAFDASTEASKERIEETWGLWYPTLNLTANTGTERLMKKAPNTDTNFDFRELDINVTQLLWDFGVTNAAIKTAQLQKRQNEETLLSTRQALALEAVSAYYNLRKFEQSLSYALQSENNIKKQAELENTRVESGQGYSTDLLQAKTQLAGAEARRVVAEGTLIQAKNRAMTVFSRPSDEVTALEAPPLPLDLLPKTLEEAVEIAKENNPQLKIFLLLEKTMEQQLKSNRASKYLPAIEASLDRKYKTNISGTSGYSEETMVKVEATYAFNLGFIANNSIRASQKDLENASRNYRDTMLTVEEQVRNAWQTLRTAQENAQLLENQANLANAFLEVAREERKLGKRSLIDVLVGETALINAQSDAAAAKADIAVATFTLLQTMGQLNMDAISGGM